MSQNNPPRRATPGGPPGARMIGPKVKLKKGTIKRFMKYIMEYRVRICIVLICIIISAIVPTRGSM